MNSKEEHTTVLCPICSRTVPQQDINRHLDTNCGSPFPQISSDRPTSSSKHRVPKTSALAPIFSSSHKPSGASAGLSYDHDSGSCKPIRKRELQSASSPAAKRSRATLSSTLRAAAPLAERLRPQDLHDFIGQRHLTDPDSLLVNLLQGGSMGSMIFWGPPGCGKTTLARLLAKQTDTVFKEVSATDAGIKEIRAIFEEAKGALVLRARRTILFLDEIHRFNKAQQDIFLPYVEQGHIQLIGATTENPSFKINGALLSRCRVFVLERLTDEDISEIITKAVDRISSSSSEEDLGATAAVNIACKAHELQDSSQPDISSSQSSTSTVAPNPFPQLTERIRNSIVSLSTGDARTALSLLELVLASHKDVDESKLLSSLRRSVTTSYDRTGDDRYDMISALHKSVRGSHGSAAMYWLARMLGAGEDPMYIARRLVVIASEDVGLADNHALPLAVATIQACQTIGMPECRINLAHCVAYLSEAPKSTRAWQAYLEAEAAAKLDPTIPVPMAIRNAPTKLMKDLGYNKGYHYNPDYVHPVHNEYLPIQFRDDLFLRTEGDLMGKVWDEDALRQWENEVNGGKDWDGRSTACEQ